MQLKISRKRREFGGPYKFTDRDADSSEIVEFRQHKDPNFELKRGVQDKGLQACPSWTAKWKTQSAWAQVGKRGAESKKLTRRSTTKKGHLLDKKQKQKQVNFGVEELLAHREIPLLVDGHTQTAYFRNKNRALQVTISARYSLPIGMLTSS